MREIKSSKVQPISGKSINKMNINSQYGIMAAAQYAISLGLQIPTPMLGRGNGKSAFAMSQMQGRILRHMGLDEDLKKNHAVSKTYPFEYTKVTSEDCETLETLIQQQLGSELFRRRIDAEVYRLNMLIKHTINKKKTFRAAKNRFKSGKQVYGKFNGYQNENTIKKQRLVENAKLDKIVVDYRIQLENLEEDHPEWLI